MLETVKNLFRSKKKKLILDIKKKHKKNITDNDINDYRRKHKSYPDSTSDNDILMLILSEDLEVKSAHPRNTEKVEPFDSVVNYHSSPTTKSSRNDDNYSSRSYDSGSSYSYSSSDSNSSSSCD